jgi:tetratricopeptide (TPR) repeat protein
MTVVVGLRVAILAGIVCCVATSSTSSWAQESQIDSLRTTARSNGSDAAAALALARALRRAGHVNEAIAETRRGIAIGASKPDAMLELHWELARAHMDQHDFRQALGACGALGRLRGATADGHACAAGAHLVWLRASEALTETAAALASDPRCFEAKIAEGRAEDLALDFPKSEAAFRTAIAWRPQNADAHVLLGRLLWKNGAKDEARVELKRAVELDPNGPDALFALSTALSPSAETTTLLARATRERPSFAEAWLALARQDLSAGDIANAKSAAEEAVRNDPKSAEPHVLLGKVALADQRPDDAIKEGETALKILANMASAKLLVADASAKLGEIDRALEAYQAAWGLDHADPTPLVHASEACHAAGRDTSARAFGVRATQEFPEWGPAWSALGDALAAQGEKGAARDAYAKALTGNGPIDRDALRKKLARP